MKRAILTAVSLLLFLAGSAHAEKSIPDQIGRHWKPPRLMVGDQKITVTFEIDSAGKLESEVEVTQSSGIEALDQSCVEAIRQALPFEREPGDQPVQIHFTFAYSSAEPPEKTPGFEDLQHLQAGLDYGTWHSMRTFHLTEEKTEPLKVYVDEKSPIYHKRYGKLVDKALKAWSKALDGRLRAIAVSRPDEAHIEIGWVDSFNYQLAQGRSITLGSEGKAGETLPVIGKARIQIGIGRADYNSGVMLATIMHEIGHALGIYTHSEESGDIMSSILKPGETYEAYLTYSPRLSKRDEQAIRFLYSSNWQPGAALYPSGE